MKVRLSFKTPDVVDDAAKDIKDEDERAKFKMLAGTFFEYGEYVEIEVDTETGTARVVPVEYP